MQDQSIEEIRILCNKDAVIFSRLHPQFRVAGPLPELGCMKGLNTTTRRQTKREVLVNQQPHVVAAASERAEPTLLA